MRRVLVTGASRGIGRATAFKLAEDGFDIAIHYCSRMDAAEDVCKSIRTMGRNATTLAFDLADREGVRAAIDNDMTTHGAYYGIVCNAGLHEDAAFPAMTDNEWDSVIRTNLDGFYNVVQPCIMPMIHRKDGGRIVALSSASGLIGNRGQVNYSAAKAGLNGAVKALAVELAKRRITVNSVAPGLIETDMVNSIAKKIVQELVPVRRMGTVDEVAGLISYIFSDSAAYVTRQVISINGGMF